MQHVKLSTQKKICNRTRKRKTCKRQGKPQAFTQIAEVKRSHQAIPGATAIIPGRPAPRSPRPGGPASRFSSRIPEIAPCAQGRGRVSCSGCVGEEGAAAVPAGRFFQDREKRGLTKAPGNGKVTPCASRPERGAKPPERAGENLENRILRE